VKENTDKGKRQRGVRKITGDLRFSPHSFCS